MSVDLDVSARRLAILLLAVIAVLVTGHLVGWLFQYVLGHDRVFGLIGLDARHREETASAPWFGLGGIFLFLSWDEIFGIHDRTSEAMHDGALSTGTFFYVWVIP